MAGLRATEDSGLTVTEGYRSVDKYSVCREEEWPYVERQFSMKPSKAAYDAALKFPDFEYTTLDNNLNQLRKCLADGYPITFGAALFESFMSAQTAKTGIIPVPNVTKEKRQGGHCMCLIGYDDDKRSFLLLNSWGVRWGLKGSAWIHYDYVLNKDLCTDFCSARAFK